MKVRKAGQNAPADVAARDFKRELEEREAKLSKEGELLKSQISVTFSKVSEQEVASALPAIEGSWDDVAVDSRDKDDARLGKLASENMPDWASSYSEDDRENSEGSSSEDDEDSEDEDAALMRELEQIKRERAVEAAEKVGASACPRSAATAVHALCSLSDPPLSRRCRSAAACVAPPDACFQDRKQKEQENAMRADALLRGNPLVQPSGSSSANVKRRWDDDVVFRNMARDEPAEKKLFINDTIRSDFHKRFLKRYVQ